MDKMDSLLLSVLLNGERREIPEGLNIETLLAWMGVDASRVAVELNRQIVRRPDWPKQSIHAGAELEIVMFVGGGMACERDNLEITSFGHH
jgi:thiamine biosynthesis protein ThiS